MELKFLAIAKNFNYTKLTWLIVVCYSGA